MWAVSDNIADLITAIIGSGLLYFLLIYGVDFHRFINMGVPGYILSSIFIFLCEELLFSLFFIPLNNLSVNLKGKLYYIRYIGGSIYSGDFILNIILQALIILSYKSSISPVILYS